jgi:cytochrome c553
VDTPRCRRKRRRSPTKTSPTWRLISRSASRKIEAGRAKAATCAACHGPEGVAAAPQWPNLAGQHETYLQVALERYKVGDRVDMVMNPLIAQLDEQTIEELAAFFASQPHLHNTEP